MNKIDPKFTQEILNWMNDSTEDMALSGAMLLQRINPRNISYRRWISMSVERPNSIYEKIKYELGKHLKYRLDGLTLDQVNKLDQEVVPEASTIIASGEPDVGGVDSVIEDGVKRLGKREDHDLLPEKVKALWDSNATLYKDIKSFFEELKSMEDLPSCQRYDKLQLMSAMDQKYLRQMNEYDSYIISDNPDDESTGGDVIKQVNNARSYLSKKDNRQNLYDLKMSSEKEGATEDEKKAYEDLLNKMQQRVDIILSAKAPVTEELKAEFIGLGLVFNEKSDNTESSEKSE